MKCKGILPLLLLPVVAQACAWAQGTPNPQALVTDGNLQSKLAITWNFDGSAEPQTHNGWNAKLVRGKPRLTEGLRGRSVLVEEESQNLLPPGSAGCTDVAAFTPLGGANLQLEGRGENATLRIQADGQRDRQGVETGPATAPEGNGAWVTGSLLIGGKGKVRVELWDVANRIYGAPLYLDLKPEFTRASPPPINTTVPGGELRLRITTVERAPADFRIGQLQIEPGQSSTSWLPGKTRRPLETLEYEVAHANTGLTEGTLYFWIKPNWTGRTELTMVRDGKRLPRYFVSFRNGNSLTGLYWPHTNGLSSGGTSLAVPTFYDRGWHFCALTWNGKTGMLYADGQGVPITITPIHPKARLVLGPDSNAAFDEMALLTTALPKDELDKLWRTGSGS